MRIEELTEEPLFEARMVWRKSGNTVKRGVRCTSGPRKGRVVSTSAQCSKPINLKKRFQMKRTKAKFGKRMGAKARRTKRMNPASRRVRSLNKSTRRR